MFIIIINFVTDATTKKKANRIKASHYGGF